MSRSVLIVDDDAGFRGIAARMVRASGLAVAGEAETAAAALAAAGSLRPDGALVDVGLPDRDGVELAQELAALPWAPRVLLISSDADVARLLPHGADGRPLTFVAKQDLPGVSLPQLLGGD